MKFLRVILIIQCNTKHWQYGCGYTPDQSCDVGANMDYIIIFTRGTSHLHIVLPKQESNCQVLCVIELSCVFIF